MDGVGCFGCDVLSKTVLPRGNRFCYNPHQEGLLFQPKRGSLLGIKRQKGTGQETNRRKPFQTRPFQKSAVKKGAKLHWVLKRKHSFFLDSQQNQVEISNGLKTSPLLSIIFGERNFFLLFFTGVCKLFIKIISKRFFFPMGFSPRFDFTVLKSRE